MMKQLSLLVLSLCAYVTLCASDDRFSDWLQRGHVSRRSESRDFGGRPKTGRETDYAMRVLLEELLEELGGSEGKEREQESKAKRKAFWQPMMGGPLPVETRLASFGSRIEPDRTDPGAGPNGIKAMRYGRRR